MTGVSPKSLARLSRTAAVALLALSLGACNLFTRLSEVGKPPDLRSVENPAPLASRKPVEMPMPPPQSVAHEANSLWRAGAQQFLKDQRAAKVGDILTVLIEIDDKAEINNKSTRSRDNTEDASVNALFGYESSLSRVLPEAILPGSLIDLDSKTSNEGLGTIVRDETIELKIAAIVSQLLPNGNLVIHGRQEVRVNYETRDLQIAGVIRPEDISSSNTISYEKIAEARIVYGGRGQITDVQQPRYGTQVIDILFPF